MALNTSKYHSADQSVEAYHMSQRADAAKAFIEERINERYSNTRPFKNVLLRSLQSAGLGIRKGFAKARTELFTGERDQLINRKHGELQRDFEAYLGEQNKEVTKLEQGLRDLYQSSEYRSLANIQSAGHDTATPMGKVLAEVSRQGELLDLQQSVQDYIMSDVSRVTDVERQNITRSITVFDSIAMHVREQKAQFDSAFMSRFHDALLRLIANNSITLRAHIDEHDLFTVLNQNSTFRTSASSPANYLASVSLDDLLNLCSDTHDFLHLFEINESDLLLAFHQARHQPHLDSITAFAAELESKCSSYTNPRVCVESDEQGVTYMNYADDSKHEGRLLIIEQSPLVYVLEAKDGSRYSLDQLSKLVPAQVDALMAQLMPINTANPLELPNGNAVIKQTDNASDVSLDLFKVDILSSNLDIKGHRDRITWLDQQIEDTAARQVSGNALTRKNADGSYSNNRDWRKIRNKTMQTAVSYVAHTASKASIGLGPIAFAGTSLFAGLINHEIESRRLATEPAFIPQSLARDLLDIFRTLPERTTRRPAMKTVMRHLEAATANRENYGKAAKAILEAFPSSHMLYEVQDFAALRDFGVLIEGLLETMPNGLDRHRLSMAAMNIRQQHLRNQRAHIRREAFTGDDLDVRNDDAVRTALLEYDLDQYDVEMEGLATVSKTETRTQMQQRISETFRSNLLRERRGDAGARRSKIIAAAGVGATGHIFNWLLDSGATISSDLWAGNKSPLSLTQDGFDRTISLIESQHGYVTKPVTWWWDNVISTVGSSTLDWVSGSWPVEKVGETAHWFWNETDVNQKILLTIATAVGWKVSKMTPIVKKLPEFLESVAAQATKKTGEKISSSGKEIFELLQDPKRYKHIPEMKLIKWPAIIALAPYMVPVMMFYGSDISTWPKKFVARIEEHIS